MSPWLFSVYMDGVVGRNRPHKTWEGKVEQYLREGVGGGGRVLEERKRAYRNSEG